MDSPLNSILGVMKVLTILQFIVNLGSCHLKCNNSKPMKAKKMIEHKTGDSEDKRPSKHQALNIQKSFLCEKENEESDIHQVSTFDADTNLWAMIAELQDSHLIARIDRGDQSN